MSRHEHEEADRLVRLALGAAVEERREGQEPEVGRPGQARQAYGNGNDRDYGGDGVH